MRFLLCGHGTSEILWSIHAALVDLGHDSVLALPDISQDIIDRPIDALFVLNLFQIPRETIEMLLGYVASFGKRPTVIHICLNHPVEEIGAQTVEVVKEADQWMDRQSVFMWCMCPAAAQQANRMGLSRVFHEPLGVHRWIYTARSADGTSDLYKRWMSLNDTGLARHPYAAMRGEADTAEGEALVRDRFLYLGQGWPDHIPTGPEITDQAISAAAATVAGVMMERPELNRIQAMDQCGLAEQSADPGWSLRFNRAFTIAFSVENRRRFSTAIRVAFKETFMLRGNGWERLGVDADPMSTALRNAYGTAAACLDFGSLAFDTAVFPRTLEIIKRNGLLVGWRHTDSARLFGPYEQDLAFIDESDAVRILARLAGDPDQREKLRKAHLSWAFDSLALTGILPRIIARMRP
ncbi:hypothetical protein A6A40_06475 [Azospirillum humicireducens]|uniref:Glycosyltransferase family 1 protein n=1 Tax=Azospirillum humicireducens TaxID=1226968 RepID=A0A160JFB0_9PROT|nr:hypothetical protein [Azospirillum humicireducens]ANC91573.1 hypothetical protein A6A40_06475 [Azospirillum humicireducens]